ncbi:hypothetical protein M2138_001467 [Dysgonomonadaceae bacterium PH5-43]|nr:hypothetical protein [Dysgonomonadaceae bacterium PH5-43]
MKKNIYHYAIAVLFMLTAMSCEKQTETEATTDNNFKIVDIDFSNEKDVYFSQIADSITYVQLETNKECLIGQITDVKYKNGIYYISDKSYTIFLFDNKGKFISKLNKVGQGPGEYSYIQSFDVDTKGNIHILDLFTKKILVYTSDIEFTSSTSGIEDLPQEFYVTDEKYVLYMLFENLNYRRGLYSLDRETDQYTEIIKIQGGDTPRTNGYITHKGNGNYCVLDDLSSNIYYLQKDSLINTIHIQGEEISEGKYFDTRRGTSYFLRGFYDYDNLLFLLLGKEGAFAKFCIHDKKKNKTFVCKEVHNDIKEEKREHLFSTNIASDNAMVNLLLSVDEENPLEENNPVIQKIHLKK